jgi:hypothetical protein
LIVGSLIATATARAASYSKKKRKVLVDAQLAVGAGGEPENAAKKRCNDSMNWPKTE